LTFNKIKKKRNNALLLLIVENSEKEHINMDIEENKFEHHSEENIGA